MRTKPKDIIDERILERILKELQAHGEKLGSIDGKMTVNNLLLQQIADNTNCACEALKAIRDKLIPLSSYVFTFGNGEAEYEHFVATEGTAKEFFSVISALDGEPKEFSVQSKPAWITVEAIQSAGFTFTVAPNTGAERVGTVVFIQNGSGKLLTFHVRQNPADIVFVFEDGKQDYYGTFDANGVDNDTGDNALRRSVISRLNNLNQPFAVTSQVPSWLTVVIQPYVGITVMASANVGEKERTATLTFTQETTNAVITVHVVQLPKVVQQTVEVTAGYEVEYDAVDHWKYYATLQMSQGTSCGASASVMVTFTDGMSYGGTLSIGPNETSNRKLIHQSMGELEVYKVDVSDKNPDSCGDVAYYWS